MAFGPNVGKIFLIRGGGEEETFQLSNRMSTLNVEMRNPNRSKSITFVVPSPISPVQLGAEADTRTLGIGFFSLKIIPKK